MRCLFQTLPARMTAKVYSKNEFGEFTVRFYENGILNSAADYFADDLDDACATALFQFARSNA